MDDALILAAAVTAVVPDGGRHAAAFASAGSAAQPHRAVVHRAGGVISVQARVTVARALLPPRAHACRHELPSLRVTEDAVGRRPHFRHTHDGPDPSFEKRG
ncbi:hypothetical protein ACH427_31250 [Streptomyces sp. NPDC020379]|uniref:hypothetical protein n=1 Tax=Streptomyces sp. NPDC020379 TaxID=3365071 RepID=UPI003789FBDB